jgi:hypothetical protein
MAEADAFKSPLQANAIVSAGASQLDRPAIGQNHILVANAITSAAGADSGKLNALQAGKARLGKAKKNAPAKLEKLKVLKAVLDEKPEIPMKELLPKVNEGLRKKGFGYVNERTVRRWKNEVLHK